MTEVAREPLYKALSENGDPRLTDAVGAERAGGVSVSVRYCAATDTTRDDIGYLVLSLCSCSARSDRTAIAI